MAPATPTPSITPTPISQNLPLTLQPTQTAPAQVALQARLAVLTSRAMLLRGGSAQEIQQAQSADIQVDDRIEIADASGQREQSYSLLQVPGSLNVELFATTNLLLAEATQAADGSTEVTLDLEQGPLFVHLNPEKNVRVTVRTSHATITSLTSGAEFDVCRTAALTCVMVKRGVVEVVARGDREIIREGSAGVILNDQPLSPAICAPLARIIAWEERYRLSANAPALHEEMAALPQAPCARGANGLPWNARIYYQDEFSQPSTGWRQGTIDHFTVGYVRSPGVRTYQVQAQDPDPQRLVAPGQDSAGQVVEAHPAIAAGRA